jgi:hypothetical protein
MLKLSEAHGEIARLEGELEQAKDGTNIKEG